MFYTFQNHCLHKHHHILPRGWGRFHISISPKDCKFRGITNEIQPRHPEAQACTSSWPTNALRVLPARSTKLSPSASCRLGRRRSSVTKWAKYLSVECGGRASGKQSHMAVPLQHVEVHFHENVQRPKMRNLWEHLLTFPQKPGSRCRCKNPAETMWDLLCLVYEEPLKNVLFSRFQPPGYVGIFHIQYPTYA